MVSGNSFTKFMLIVCGIVLVTAAFSGCTDADAPSNIFDEKTWQGQLDNGISMDEAYNKISPIAKSNNLDVDVIRSKITGDITSIQVDDGNNNILTVLDDDSDPYADRITLGDKKLYPTASTVEASSPSTQLSKEPTGSSGDSAIHTAGGYTLDDLFEMAQDDPEGFLDQDIEKYKLTGLGESNGGSGVIENSKYDLAWKNPAPGIEEYVEEYNSEDKIKAIRIIKQQGTGLSIYDLVKNNNEEGQDSKIDAILNLIDGKQTITKAE